MVVQSHASAIGRTNMKVVIRVDASLDIGTGHVYRCLTLADVLRSRGAECHFICREHSGHLMALIAERGYPVFSLGQPSTAHIVDALAHAHWLGVSQEQDASECATLLQALRPDWLIVDHYGLDVKWQAALRQYVDKLVVIDDLADRHHLSDLLVDQNLGRTPCAYQHLVPSRSTLLIGPEYALLRPEFAQLRSSSLQRRNLLTSPRQILVSMGGVDRPNATALVLEALQDFVLTQSSHVCVIMGATAPWTDAVSSLLQRLSFSSEVLVNVRDMARLMADCDLAIGAAGGSSWERCCLGLPTLLVTLADNQLPGAKALHEANAARWLGGMDAIARNLPPAFKEVTQALGVFSQNAATLCDGLGAERVASYMLGVK